MGLSRGGVSGGVVVVAGVVVDAAHEALGALSRLLQAPLADEEATVMARERRQFGDHAGAGGAECGGVLEVGVERMHVRHRHVALQLSDFS